MTKSQSKYNENAKFPILQAYRPLLTGWLTQTPWPGWWASATLMFQKEVAQRIVAKPGGKAYGRLALLAQWRCDAQIVLTLPPQAFVPAPKVESAVVHLTALPEPRFPADPKLLEEITRAAFNQRRKMLRQSLKSLLPDPAPLLDAVGIAATRPSSVRCPLSGSMMPSSMRSVVVLPAPLGPSTP